MRLLLLLFMVCFSSIGLTQDQQLDTHINLLIESFQKDKIYESNGLKLMRVDRGQPKRKDSIKFKKLIDCSFSLSFCNEPKDSLPEAFNAYGLAFTQIDKSSNTVKYQSDENDSEIHFITFVYDEFSEPKLVNKVQVDALNTRSNKLSPKYLYRFIRTRRK